jgi:hypothetical protein
MAYIISGGVPTMMTIEPSNMARTTLRPNEITGSYRVAATVPNFSFNYTAAVNRILYNFKFAPGSINSNGGPFCVVRSVTAQVYINNGTLANRVPLSLYVVRSYNTQGTTGGTVAINSSNYCKKRTSFGSPSVTAYITSTTANITEDKGSDGGNLTSANGEDAVRYSQIFLGNSSTANAPLVYPPDGPRDFINNTDRQNADYVSHPLVLASQEGFRIKNDIAYLTGYTGVSGYLTFVVEWDEVTSY